MGYCVSITCNELVIPKEKVSDCLKAVNSLWGPDGQPSQACGGGSIQTKGGKDIINRWYSWVENPPPGGYPTLVKALEAWWYKAEECVTGDIFILEFTGEKLGDDELLYYTISPFVRDGGSIVCVGEDTYKWRYFFKNGVMNKQHSKTVWYSLDDNPKEPG